MSLLQRIEVFSKTKKAKIAGGGQVRDRPCDSVTELPNFIMSILLHTYCAVAAEPIFSTERQPGPLQAVQNVGKISDEYMHPHQSDTRTLTTTELSEILSAPCGAPDARPGKQAAEPGSEDDRRQECADVNRPESGDQASVSGKAPGCTYGESLMTWRLQTSRIIQRQCCLLSLISACMHAHVSKASASCREDPLGCIQLLWQIQAERCGALCVTPLGCSSKKTARSCG